MTIRVELPGMRLVSVAQERRFWSRVSLGPDCWEWAGHVMPNGYGQVSVGHTKWLAHRLSWAMHRGHIPGGLYVLHKCDNRRCVRPLHLFLGTAQDNALDMVSKGRGRHHHGLERARAVLRADPEKRCHGERTNTARLTEAAVRDIRARYAAGMANQRQLAEEYDVSTSTVCAVVNGQSWRTA